ncbi:hypothetical protein B0W48_02535 [Pseudoalteromonas aliena]|uniref:Uncharacterized protein n=1 Tax=Pseudoalteromonas aliena TaxID=247523 RepID=A0A1Q2GUH0_9GAMM|nr:hypothetical protein B0W48_02535 [Pseudoalteromonas aliena]
MVNRHKCVFEIRIRIKGNKELKSAFYCLQLGPVYLSRLNLQPYVWYLGKAEPMVCGYSP